MGAEGSRNNRQEGARDLRGKSVSREEGDLRGLGRAEARWGLRLQGAVEKLGDRSIWLDGQKLWMMQVWKQGSWRQSR